MFTPLVNSNPKLGTSAGAMGAYIKPFNPQAPPSMFGAHALKNDYAMLGTNDIADLILEELDLEGFNANALGLKALYDSRDNTQSPSNGRLFMANQFAYREAFGGEESFDVYSAQYRQYFPQRDGSVLAARVTGRFSHDALRSGYSTLRPREKMILRLDYALGEGGTEGLYVKFGQSF